VSSGQDWCKHYNGMAKNKACDAGIEYKSLCAKFTDMPCVYRHPDVAECSKLLLMTQSEADEYEQGIADLIGYLAKCDQLIAKMPGGAGVIECPKCSNSLHWTRASNGHVWGKCKTDKCMGWME
jgi:hypothetical protein